ncbi:SEP domain-containing protein [Colletotrichum truncatum]|uniref:SEP domain-containing protein n=1 Tax=Colletotrichum truncatum TaxID=5467 RepID=A0ACC3ZHJ4_COLTU|nr:SEP domain-containing protein [Colletotrichum truncatum]KAF6790488.1 SEP domain-containing protein [Colletotrichum truncatum]
MSGSNSASRNNILRDFTSLTGLPEARCTEYLEAANWDIGLAAQAYYADHDSEGEIEPVAQAPAQPAAAPAEEYTGPRTLDGRPAPQAAQASTSRKAPPKKKGLATLSSLGGGGHAHDDDDDEDDDDYDDRGRGDLFAGGEKSGLAVQDPSQEGGGTKKIINDILAKAKANASRPETASPAGPSRSNIFRGTGQTLGGEGVESRSIPDPNTFQEGSGGPPGQTGEPQERTLHLWQDGFSIDDGELHRFDDPENAMDLNMIRAGRAPLHLMNVRYDQPVDVKLHQHQENYRPLPKKYKPFGGEGRRLGSPVPGEGSSSASTTAASTTTASAPTGSSATQHTVDESQPTLTLRIQLPNGTRLPARFNTTNTVDDVYEFVQRASPDTRTRSWVLATTFPNKDHTDRSLVLGEMLEFKKGGTAVVKWA